MSIFTNRIISKAYMSMYKTRTPIMESRSYIYESAIDRNIHKSDELADSIAKYVAGSRYGKEVKNAAGIPQRYVRSGRVMLYNAEYIKHLVGEKIPFSKDQKSNAKFFLGATRIFGEILKNAESEGDVNRKCSEFNKILGVIVHDNKHINEYDNNLAYGKGDNRVLLSLRDLKDKFRQEIEEISKKEQEEINSKEYTRNKKYTITPCNTWDDMLQFGEYTDWCVAQEEGGEEAYVSYTDDGVNKFYVCTREGYEDLEPEPGPNCPLDDYGLSMIAICVDPKGNLKTCTCRWNHDHGGNDNIMDAQQISELLGVNFFERFDPSRPENEFDSLDYYETDKLCSNFGFRIDGVNNYCRIEDNKLIKYKLCYRDSLIVCLANTHFEWYDINSRDKIEPPKSINGTFKCSYWSNLTSLKGSPSEIVGDFDCSHCSNLISLKGSPNKVNGSFYCPGCDSLTSLEGAPSEVFGDFVCRDCKNLRSLKGAPSEVGRGFHCPFCYNLTSLDGAPNKVGENFDCSYCKNLTSLKGSPNKVGEDFYCYDCTNLLSLEGAPSEVGEWLHCHGCKKLTSIDDVPESIRKKIFR